MKDKLLELLSSIPVDKINFMKSVLQVLLSLKLLDKIINYFKRIEVLGYKIVNLSYHRGKSYYSNFFLMELDVKNPKSNDVFISEVIIKNIELNEYTYSDIYIDCHFDNESQSLKFFSYNNGNVKGNTSNVKIKVYGSDFEISNFKEIEEFEIESKDIEPSSILLYWILDFRKHKDFKKYRKFKVEIIFKSDTSIYTSIFYDPCIDKFLKQYGGVGQPYRNEKLPFLEINDSRLLEKEVNFTLKKEGYSKIRLYLYFDNSYQVKFNVGIRGKKEFFLEEDVLFFVRKNTFNEIEKKINIDGCIAVQLSCTNIDSLNKSDIRISYPQFLVQNDISLLREQYSDDFSD